MTSSSLECWAATGRRWTSLSNASIFRCRFFTLSFVRRVTALLPTYADGAEYAVESVPILLARNPRGQPRLPLLRQRCPLRSGDSHDDLSAQARRSELSQRVRL